MIEAIFSMPMYITMPVVLVGYSAACLAVGILVLKLLRVPIDGMERISAGTILATGFILGEGILASLWLLLALAGWFSIEIVGTICLLCAISGLYMARPLFSALRMQLELIWHELRQETWAWQAVAGLTVVLCLLWITSLGRSLAGDGPAFYFALGKLVAFSHRLVPLPGYEIFTNIGLQGELHFAALMVLHSPEAAKLFAWPTISMTGIMLTSLGRLAGMGRRGQWLTLGILFTSSAVVWLSGDGKVDLFAAALAVAAFYWAVQIRVRPSRTTLLLTGLFSGFSIVAKLSYAVVMVPTIALLVLWGYGSELLKNKNHWQPALRSFWGGCLLILAGLLLAFIPHFVKNGLLYGNPISPIGSGGIGWLNQTWFGPDVTRHILLTYPLALTYGSFWAQYGDLSPLILAFLPLTVFLPRPRPFFSSVLLIITLVAVAGIVSWAIYNPSVFSPRYILAVLLLLILLPARAAEYASLHDCKPRLLAAGTLFFTLTTLIFAGLSFINQVFFPGMTAQYLIGTMDECKRDGQVCEAINKINMRAGVGSRVYLASFQRYWLRGDLLQCVSNAQDQISDRLSGEALWLKLYEDGFDFILVDSSTHAYVLERLDLGHLPKWVAVKSIFDTPPFTVYQIKFSNPPSMVQPADCQRLPSSTIWEVQYP